MKRAVKSYRAASKSIVRMLRPHSMVIDVEFVLVAEALERFASTVFSYAQLKPLPATNINTHVSRFVDVATNYAALLIELGQDPATLLRCLQSPRLQHGLIGRNMLLFQGMAHILQIIYASQSVSQQKPTHNAVQASQTPQEAVRELLSASGLDFGLENTEAHQFWEENWPDEVFAVPWTHFQTALIAEFPNATLKALTSLQYLLDFSNTGVVSKTRLNSLLRLAPSFAELVPFAATLMSRSWFYGFLSKNEATLLLQQEPVHTFIIRLHKNSRGALACSYMSNRGVQHAIIQYYERSGYSMHNCEGTYDSIDALIAQNSFLKYPLTSQLWVRSPYFLGEATKEEAEMMLRGLNEGVYVVRIQSTAMVNASSSIPFGASASPSSASTPACRDSMFMIAVNASAGMVRHMMLPRDLQGNFISVASAKTSPDLQTYLESHKSTFSMPFSPTLPKFHSLMEIPAPLPPGASPSSNNGSVMSHSPTEMVGTPSSTSSSMSLSSSRHLLLHASSGGGGNSSHLTMSLSSSVGIPRPMVDHLSSSTISRDDLSASLTSDSPVIDDDLPIIDVSTMSLIIEPSTSHASSCDAATQTPIATRRPWRPLTSSELNPLDITYKDMWAELLRYYHVPVPEAKIPPKTFNHYNGSTEWILHYLLVEALRTSHS